MYSRAKKPSHRQVDFWPSWRYSPDGEGRVFNSAAEVPFGWTKRVGQQLEEVAPPELNKTELIEQLTALGVEINPIWGTAHLKKVLDDRSTSR